MKKAISLFLALVMMVSMSVPAFATENSEEYYTIQVEYSDNIGHQESLDVMIQNDNVFVEAEMLSERLGYTFGENGEIALIYNKDTSNNLPFGITQFKYNSTQVSHMLFNNMIDTYEAPFSSVKNNEGSWIPFEYSLLLLNSGLMITDNAVLIDIPTKRIIDYFFDMAKNSTKYSFDWADDFGYTEIDIKVLGGSSHLINVFNGLLGFDGASWATLFQQFAGSTASYDKKYGENLAMLICTESDKELQATTEKVKLLSSLLNEDGDLGKLLSFTSDMTDFQVGSLYKQCEAVLDGIKTGNSSAVDYSRAYQALEKALDKQTWFSHTGGNILDIQKGVSSATGKAFSFLDVGVKVAEIVGYAQEFQNQDEFSLVAFTHYLESANSGLELPDTMKASMIDYSDALSKSIDGYMGKRFLDNIDQWMLDAAKEQVPLHKVLGTQAAVALIAWDIASKTIPFIANGLSGADNFELALYSMVFQGDTFLNYLSKRNSAFADVGNITAENMYELSQYGYIYLKSCYVTREAALASLANKSGTTKEKIQPLIDYQNSINTEIAEIMVELKGANKTNDSLVFGFLPTNNKDYLSKYDDSQMIRWIVSRELVTDAYTETYTDEFGTYVWRVPKIMLSGDNVESINDEIWETLFAGAVSQNHEGIQQGDTFVAYDVIDYTWAVNGNILSLVTTINSSTMSWTDYDVYNVDVTTGSKLSRDTLLNTYGYSLDEYYKLAEQVLGSKFWSGWDRDNENFQNNSFVSWFNDALQKTISQENIDQSFPYINSKGELCIIAKIYSLAGADYYWNNLNMSNFTLIPDYATPVESNPHTNTVSGNGWEEAYRSILLQHPDTTSFTYGSNTIYIDTEYTVYDIDTNGIPELIVKEDMSNYYVYSFNGTDVVTSDQCYWSYDDCLYEYEGNGIVVHNGGMGSMRIEDASLYSMVNNKLEWTETRMSTEVCFFDELYSFLDSLTPIDDFHPIIDDSYLSN